MKKLNAVFVLFLLLVALMMGLALLYVDLSKHQQLQYAISSDGVLSGYQSISRFDTENSIVYRGTRRDLSGLEMPSVRQSVKLDKRSGLDVSSLSYTFEGVGGSERAIKLSVLPDDTYKYLYLDAPIFCDRHEPSDRNPGIFFVPDDIVSYLSLIERYDFWKKGVQNFQVAVIASDIEMPPFDSVLTIRFLQEEYLNIMGTRMPVERYSISVRNRPLAELYVGKHNRAVLALDLFFSGELYKVVSFPEGPVEKIKNYLSYFASMRPGSIFSAIKTDQPDVVLEPLAPDRDFIRERFFFDSQRLVLSAEMLLPVRDGTFPTVIMVPPAGAQPGKHKASRIALAKELLDGDMAVVFFDHPGHDISRPIFASNADDSRAQDIIALVEHIKNRQSSFQAKSFHLLARDHSSFVAAMAAFSDNPGIQTLSLINAPLSAYIAPLEGRFRRYRVLLADTEKSFIERVNSIKEGISNANKRILAGRSQARFFMGERLPIREFRDFLMRDPSNMLKTANVPVLLLYGRDSAYYVPERLDEIAENFSAERDLFRAVVIRTLGEYGGVFTLEEKGRVFVPDQDMVRAIVDWIISWDTEFEEVVQE